MLAFSQSLHHELKDKGMRIQAVLPGATATEFWGVAGMPVAHLPQEIVMTTEDMVDAALSGLSRAEPAARYKADPDGVDIVRILHARMDFESHLGSRPA